MRKFIDLYVFTGAHNLLMYFFMTILFVLKNYIALSCRIYFFFIFQKGVRFVALTSITDSLLKCVFLWRAAKIYKKKVLISTEDDLKDLFFILSKSN